MKVLVTGGTGYLGSHTVAALVSDGHQVRLLARDRARVEPAVGPLGLDASELEIALGDITDPAAVASAVDGCDAVIHAASVFSFDSRDTARMKTVNVRGTEHVLRAAVDAGADPVVHVSSLAALLPSRTTLTEDSPVGEARTPYLRSKAGSEQVARRFQDEGAPVVTVYPGVLWGPHDPHLGDQITRLRNLLRGLTPMWPIGSLAICDVRDVASLHARVMEKGHGPRRYLAPAQFLTTRALVDTVRTVTGRRLPAAFLPARVLLPAVRPVGAVQRVWPWHIPAEYEAVYSTAGHPPVDDSRARSEFGISPRGLVDTATDTIRWLHAHGHLTARQAGLLATPQD